MAQSEIDFDVELLREQYSLMADILKLFTGKEMIPCQRCEDDKTITKQ
jgi:hypothetical protein